MAIISAFPGKAKPKLQEKTVAPSTVEQIITPDSGFDGLSKATVSGDSNLRAANIKSGVSIFGVTGTYSDRAKVYVARGITPRSVPKTASDSWTSCAQITMATDAITKLIDVSNSATTFPSVLYNKYPIAVVAILSYTAISGLSTNFKNVSQIECYSSVAEGAYSNYDGAAYGSMYTSLSSGTVDRTFKLAPGTSNIIGLLYLPHNYNMSTDYSYNIYLIY